MNSPKTLIYCCKQVSIGLGRNRISFMLDSCVYIDLCLTPNAYSKPSQVWISILHNIEEMAYQWESRLLKLLQFIWKYIFYHFRLKILSKVIVSWLLMKLKRDNANGEPTNILTGQSGQKLRYFCWKPKLPAERYEMKLQAHSLILTRICF